MVLETVSLSLLKKKKITYRKWAKHKKHESDFSRGEEEDDRLRRTDERFYTIPPPE
jgi:hypothetical protein